jgi:hypothetical protein
LAVLLQEYFVIVQEEEDGATVLEIPRVSVVWQLLLENIAGESGRTVGAAGGAELWTEVMAAKVIRRAVE